MNSEVLSAHFEDDAEACLARVLAFGVSGVPVVDDEGKVRGVLSWRDLVGMAGPVKRHMSFPPATVSTDSTIDAAALLMAQSGHHRLVVVDRESRPVGVVSTLDVLRGLTGVPTSHPAAFSHFDPATSVRWSEVAALKLGALSGVPERAGIVVLIHGEAGVSEHVVWAEACSNMRGRLEQMLSETELLPNYLQDWLAQGVLRFKTAETDDSQDQMQALRKVLRAAKAERKAQGPE